MTIAMSLMALHYKVRFSVKLRLVKIKQFIIFFLFFLVRTPSRFLNKQVLKLTQ